MKKCLAQVRPDYRIVRGEEMEPGRETAVIFAELIGAAELYARVGDAAAHEAIARCVETLGQAAQSSGGRVIKRIGGRVMLVAASADAAARAAVAMQVAAGGFQGPDSASLALGVAFHYGPVLQQDDSDVFGDTVNLAARLVEKAAKGQILLAADTAAAVGSLFRRSIRRLYSMPVKGLSEDLQLCELVWRADEPATLYPMQAAAAEPLRAKLKLKYRGTKVVLRREREAFTIGREAGCALVVDDEHASRQHCFIQRRSDHFVLADKSTNGTYVTVEGEEEVLLQRDELTLRKHGWICFGAPRSAGGEAVEFFCE
jgi:adenylate cyclase